MAPRCRSNRHEDDPEPAGDLAGRLRGHGCRRGNRRARAARPRVLLAARRRSGKMRYSERATAGAYRAQARDAPDTPGAADARSRNAEKITVFPEGVRGKSEVTPNPFCLVPCCPPGYKPLHLLTHCRHLRAPPAVVPHRTTLEVREGDAYEKPDSRFAGGHDTGRLRGGAVLRGACPQALLRAGSPAGERPSSSLRRPPPRPATPLLKSEGGSNTKPFCLLPRALCLVPSLHGADVRPHRDLHLGECHDLLRREARRHFV